MQGHSERRYVRGTHFICTARLCGSSGIWRDARVLDLSSGGFSVATNEPYEVGEVLRLDLAIEGILSEFKVKADGVVRSKKRFANEDNYGIEFKNLSQDMKIRIDESVHGDRIVERGVYGKE